ncbi:very short patch repair endonuclease [Burkholderia ubonensis]|uniref:very short patch repair endonuclease n=1 Tax=Burkholderia ubonensis TaxID=101571 RepID=UPI0022B7579B|nr:very short patch repair endonuclease [Burkholderia ubonensis]
MATYSFSPSPGRSRIMRAIRSKDTKPELIVRRLFCQLGYKGYRLHRADLPGRPDIVFVGKRKAIFVHGCFWHGHNCSVGSRKPRVNVAYWNSKIERNRIRDKECCIELAKLGWSVLVIWECEMRDLSAVSHILQRFMLSASVQGQ